MNCPQCQRPFEQRRPDQVYCRPKCRVDHYAATTGNGGLRAPIKTVRRLADGGVSVLLRFAPRDAENAFSLLPGKVVEVIP